MTARAERLFAIALWSALIVVFLGVGWVIAGWPGVGLGVLFTILSAASISDAIDFEWESDGT